MGERMERRKEERRNQILDVAEIIIATKGINGMKMDEVAKEADVASGTLYSYFKNKNSLCAAVIVRIIKQIRTLMEEKRANRTSASKRINSSGLAVFEFKKKYPDKWKIFRELRSIHFQDNSDKNISELLSEDKKILKIITENYEEGIKKGIIRPEIDPVSTAIFMRMAFFLAFEPSSSTRKMLETESISPEQFMKEVLDLIHHAVYIDKP